jgi:uncharacterized protein (TIGR03032 family)
MNLEGKKEEQKNKEPVVGYVHTTELPAFLEQQGLSFIVTTYQAQRILVFSSGGPRLSMLMRSFERPTGIAIEGNRIALCTKNQLWFLYNTGELRDEQGNVLPYDACYAPRHSHVTGDISGHDLVWHRGQLIVVNTRFSCLSTIDPNFSFVPGWRPRFITEYAAEDRCHLNGIALDGSGPRYASALGETNTREGWRENKAKGGIIIDIPSNEVITRGLAMPHSPRLHMGKLWVLESGNGELQVIDPKNGQKTTVVRLPGYLRGLAFFDRYALVGTCKIREKSTFGGMPIEEKVSELKCSIQFIDLVSGTVRGFIEFTKGIEELFDIKILPGIRRPHVLGFEEDTINGVFVFDAP